MPVNIPQGVAGASGGGPATDAFDAFSPLRSWVEGGSELRCRRNRIDQGNYAPASTSEFGVGTGEPPLTSSVTAN